MTKNNRLIVLILIFSNLSQADEIGRSEVSTPTSKSSNIKVESSAEKPAAIESPHCFKKSSLRKGFNETDIKKIFEDLSEDEIHARLVLAESLSSGANCNFTTERQAVFEGVAWVTANRIRVDKFGKGIDSLFARRQFGSMRDMVNSNAEVLLCPTSLGDKWLEQWNLATNAVNKTKNLNNNPMPRVFHYIYGGLNRRNNNITWVSPSKRREPDLRGLKPKSDCIEFYEL